VATTDTIIGASPETIFAVLRDPRYYGYWVVGSRKIRGWDPNWPEVGSRFHHAVGKPPIVVRDHTRVEAADPPRYLRLRAKARPLGTAFVELTLEETGAGTRVVMTEGPADRLTALIFMPLTHLLVRKRNDVALSRLKELAEGRGPTPEQAASA
jgi:uncharacterized protein YndB with AHSA1/START domain